jgi:c(7)-type cytochrome triheme protein
MRIAAVRVWGLAILTGIVLGLLAASGGHAQVKMPDDFTFEQGKGDPGPVTFSHTKHRDNGVDKCQACHVKVFKMKRGQTGPLTMEKMKAGEQCGACHTGTTKVGDKVVFAVNNEANCGKCHKKS